MHWAEKRTEICLTPTSLMMKRSRPSNGLCPGVTGRHGRQSGWWTTEPGELGRELAHARENGHWTPGAETGASPVEARGDCGCMRICR